MRRFIEFFRGPPPVASAAALAEFIDRNAAFLVQKGIYEYARARAGHYSKVLFRETGFQTAVENSRWRTYPLGLAIVAEVAEGQLRAAAGEHRQAQLDELSALVLSIFDRYPVPAALGAEVWGNLRSELERRLQLIGLHPPKHAKDIPEQFVQSYFDAMPIHEKLRQAEFQTIRNYLRVTAINIHDELAKRLDVPLVAGGLIGRAI